MTSRDNPKLREIVERVLHHYRQPIDVPVAVERVAYAVLDEVLGPLRDLVDLMDAQEFGLTQEENARAFDARKLLE